MSDKYFLDMCLDVAEKSNDPSTKVGAVIVTWDELILGTGYNCFPKGVKETTERLNDRDMKIKLVVHAEMNAIFMSTRSGISLKGCIMYMWAKDAVSGVTWGGPPCIRCAVELIQAGIDEIRVPVPKGIPERWLADLNLARSILVESGVKYVEL